MKIFVTGITGFVGGAVANYFASLGNEVMGIGRSKFLPSHISKKCRYVQADICEPLHNIDADVVIHAAGLASHTVPFEDLYSVNVLGTKNVLYAAKKVTHIIYISSSSVYHFNEHAMKEAEAGLHFKKLSGYGKSKLLAEQILFEGKTENRMTILRPRAIYGRHDHSLLPRLIKLVIGNKLFLPENISKSISLTHIGNLIQAIELCIDHQTMASEVFNVADIEVYDLHQILTTLLPLVAGKRLQTVNFPAWLFDLIVAINSGLRLSPSFNRFAADSLTKTAILNTNKINSQLNYNPYKNFYNSYMEIGHWIHQEQGWKHFFNAIPVNPVL